MSGAGRLSFYYGLFALMFAMFACRGIGPIETPELVTASATRTRPVATSRATESPTSTQPPSSTPAAGAWETVRPGLERRWLRLEDEETGRLVEQIFVLRLQPAHFTIEIGYQPGEPLLLPDWQTSWDALIVMNGGFFTPEFLTTGLVVVAGEPYGQSYEGFGGMLALKASGLELRSLVQTPYRPDEPLQYALQSFPMLILPGGQLGYPTEDGQRSRRSVIGLDRSGRLLLLSSNLGYFTLNQLATYLMASDLELERALNLDGGTSAGLLLSEPAEGVGAFVAVPTVIIVR